MRRVLRVCEDLVCHVAGEVVTVKQLMYQSLNRTELITATLNVFQSSLADAGVISLASFACFHQHSSLTVHPVFMFTG